MLVPSHNKHCILRSWAANASVSRGVSGNGGHDACQPLVACSTMSLFWHRRCWASQYSQQGEQHLRRSCDTHVWQLRQIGQCHVHCMYYAAVVNLTLLACPKLAGSQPTRTRASSRTGLERRPSFASSLFHPLDIHTSILCPASAARL